MGFSLFRRLSHNAGPEPTSADIREMIADNERMLSGARCTLDEALARLARPGDYETDDAHVADELERDYRRREISAFEDRLRRLPAEADAAAERERIAARDARLAEAPELVRQARKALAAVEKAARAHAEALAALREIEERHNALRPLARDAGRELPNMYATLNEPAVIEPEREVSEMRWGKELPISSEWVPCGGTFDGAGKPLDHAITQRPVKRTIPAQIIKPARFFESPTASTSIAGHWPRQ